jgi:two-component system, LytTR family, sensor kinase
MLVRPSRTAKRLAAIVAAWTALGLVISGQTALQLAARGADRSAWVVMGPSLVAAWIWALYTPGLVALAQRLRRLRERRGSPPDARAWCAFLGAHLVAVTLLALADSAVWSRVRPLLDGTVQPWSRVFAYTLIMNVTWYVAVVAFAEAEAFAAHAGRLAHQLDEARLRALEAQLQPHFLYNTLNLIAEMVHEEPDEADVMLTRLGALLRRSYRGSSHLVPLAEEVQFVRAYADILARRYRDRVTLTVDVPDELMTQPVPAFLLQPLVENAFRHGVERREGASDVEIAARQSDGSLELRVLDRGVAPRSRGRRHDGSEPAPGGAGDGVGLRNTRERLEVLYGSTAGLLLASGEESTVATIRLPLRPPVAPESTEHRRPADSAPLLERVMR